MRLSGCRFRALCRLSEGKRVARIHGRDAPDGVPRWCRILPDGRGQTTPPRRRGAMALPVAGASSRAHPRKGDAALRAANPRRDEWESTSKVRPRPGKIAARARVLPATGGPGPGAFHAGRTCASNESYTVSGGFPRIKGMARSSFRHSLDPRESTQNNESGQAPWRCDPGPRGRRTAPAPRCPGRPFPTPPRDRSKRADAEYTPSIPCRTYPARGHFTHRIRALATHANASH